VLCCVALFFQPARGSGGESGESRAGSRGSGSACGMRNRERKKKEAGGAGVEGLVLRAGAQRPARVGTARGSAGAGVEGPQEPGVASGEWRESRVWFCVRDEES
jgi:hypothetical protein